MTAITDTTDQVRLLIGDTDSTLFTDDQVEYFLTQRGDNVLLAASDACRALAAKFARAYDFETDGQKFNRSTMVRAYLDMAQAFLVRGDGIDTLVATRVDGYSDDIPADQVQSTNQGRQKFYTVDGLDYVP